MINRTVYLTTNHRRTHKIIHINEVTSCCLKCAIRKRQTWYHKMKWENKEHSKFPNWKMVSKNKKQWMKKPLRFIEDTSPYLRYQYIDIVW